MQKNNNKKTDINRSLIIKMICFYVFCFIVFAIIGTIFLNKSLSLNKEKIVKYSEKSYIDYNVYLIENDFYEEKSLGKDMLYVANLIDKIDIDFDYIFNSEENEKIDFDYNISAKLLITNQTGTKSYFEKNYILKDKQQTSIINENSKRIREKASIDYTYYNNIANNFKNQYGVDVECKLIVYMTINKNNNLKDSKVNGNSSTMNVTIPLSERAVDISLDYQDINQTNKIIKKEILTLKDYLPLFISIIILIVAVVLLINIIYNISLLFKKKSEYDKYIDKILKEYDRLIAESSSIISFKNKEIINIAKFSELLDIHDNLQIPIMFYKEKKKSLSYFYIPHDNIIYLYTVDNKTIKEQK